jgi:hypothetical protein
MESSVSLVSSVCRRRWNVGQPRAPPLLVVGIGVECAAHDPASPGVHEVHLPTRLAAHSPIGLSGVIGPIVRGPALDVGARVRAPEEEGRHKPSVSQRFQSTR